MMKEFDNQADSMERDLIELEAAERAGVFRRTLMDDRALFTPAADPGPKRHWLAACRWVGVAAALALVVGVWSVMFTLKIGEVRRSGMIDEHGALAVVPVGESNGILVCIGGPSAPALNGCLRHDYDSDGDVDLADFQNYQLAFAGPVTGG